MSPSPVLFSIEAALATITLNRPDKLNCLDAAMHTGLAAALARVEAGRGVRAVLLTGAGRAFCAGQDLEDPALAPGEEAPDLGEVLGRRYNPLVRRVRALPVPVVCAVNGVAAGAGANLALACDIVLAARSARFVQAFCKVGLVPDSGGSYFLPRLVGHARAMALAMLGEPVGAERAEAMGMIWRAVDDDTLMADAEALARELASQATLALGLIKRAIGASLANTLEEQLALEADLQRQAGRSDDYREGVAAFQAKRPPRFSGG